MTKSHAETLKIWKETSQGTWRLVSRQLCLVFPQYLLNMQNKTNQGTYGNKDTAGDNPIKLSYKQNSNTVLVRKSFPEEVMAVGYR